MSAISDRLPVFDVDQAATSASSTERLVKLEHALRAIGRSRQSAPPPARDVATAIATAVADRPVPAPRRDSRVALAFVCSAGLTPLAILPIMLPVVPVTALLTAAICALAAPMLARRGRQAVDLGSMAVVGGIAVMATICAGAAIQVAPQMGSVVEIGALVATIAGLIGCLTTITLGMRADTLRSPVEHLLAWSAVLTCALTVLAQS
jgi:hypothetical protein